MSDWMLLLNQFPEELERVLPLTDARFRPDVRLLESGIYDKVSFAPVTSPNPGCSSAACPCH